MQDKHETAETFFEAATAVSPESLMAWTMLGLFYDGIGNEIGAEMATMEANKLNKMAAIAEAKAARDEEQAIKDAEAAAAAPSSDDVAAAGSQQDAAGDAENQTSASKGTDGAYARNHLG